MEIELEMDGAGAAAAAAAGWSWSSCCRWCYAGGRVELGMGMELGLVLRLETAPLPSLVLMLETAPVLSLVLMLEAALVLWLVPMLEMEMEVEMELASTALGAASWIGHVGRRGSARLRSLCCNCDTQYRYLT